MEKRIYLSTPTIHEEEQQFVQSAFDTNWVAPLVPNVDKFEEEISEYIGGKRTVALSSGTAAIHLALKSQGSVAETVFENGVCLPSDIKMTDEDIRRVIDVIKGLF